VQRRPETICYAPIDIFLNRQGSRLAEHRREGGVQGPWADGGASKIDEGFESHVVRGASTPRSQSHASEQEVLTMLPAFGFEICKYDPFTRFDDRQRIAWPSI